MRFLAAVALSFCAATARAQYYGAVTGAGELTSLSVAGGSVLSTTTVLQTLYVGQGAAISTMTGTAVEAAQVTVGTLTVTGVFSGTVTMTSGSGINFAAGSTLTVSHNGAGVNPSNVEIMVSSVDVVGVDTVTFSGLISSTSYRLVIDAAPTAANFLGVVLNGVNAVGDYAFSGAYYNTGAGSTGLAGTSSFVPINYPSYSECASPGESAQVTIRYENGGVIPVTVMTSGATSNNCAQVQYWSGGASISPANLGSGNLTSVSVVCKTTLNNTTPCALTGHVELWQGITHP